MKIQPSFCLCGITRAPNAAPHSACSFFARCGAWLLALAVYACSSLPAWAHNICTNTQGVTVVLGGGGAKGFAHLAVLQKLEALRIPIRQVIGTSMGAVIGGLYASGMSTAAIEKVIRSQDPSKVALDQVDRTDLPHRTRAYQQQYPVDLELGVKSGQLSFARGVSDGQRFLALLQELTAHIPANGSFDALKIPFRAVATRLSDGEMVVLDHGSLPLAIRASMSAPGVFAPLEIGEETYIDGGLVANLPVEVALREGASTIVASYLGDTDRVDTTAEPSNALTVANRMLVLLVRQNERRNIALLRPQDILVRPAMQNYRFGDFQRAEEIMQAGQQAIATQADRFQALADQSPCETTPIHPPPPSATTTTTPVAIQIAAIEVRGNEYVPSAYIEDFLRPLLHTAYSASAVSLTLDALYTTGNFERLNYQLRTTDDMQVQLVIDVKEKPYGPTYIKTSLGFFSESSGSNMFSAGAGLRRPWLTPSGLELTVDALMGSQTHLAASLFQPLPSQGWGLNAYAAYKSLDLPIYRSDIGTAQKMALSTLRRQEAGMNLSYDFSKQFTSKLGLSANVTSTAINTARNINYTNADGSPVVYSLQDSSEPARNVYAQFTADVLDSPSFPTRGYFANLLAVHSQGSSVQWESIRFNTLLTYSAGSHVLHLGVNLGTDKALDCEDCTDNSGSLSPLFLGGFQAMGAYQVGQLRGDRLAHAQSTYMYRLSDGGLLRQPTYVGVVLEVGDAWLHTASMQHRYSGTGFIAIDSKIGDVFFGVASGSDNNKNIFIQLGKRFTVW